MLTTVQYVDNFCSTIDGGLPSCFHKTGNLCAVSWQSYVDNFAVCGKLLLGNRRRAALHLLLLRAAWGRENLAHLQPGSGLWRVHLNWMSCWQQGLLHNWIVLVIVKDWIILVMVKSFFVWNCSSLVMVKNLCSKFRWRRTALHLLLLRAAWGAEVSHTFNQVLGCRGFIRIDKCLPGNRKLLHD